MFALTGEEYVEFTRQIFWKGIVKWLNIAVCAWDRPSWRKFCGSNLQTIVCGRLLSCRAFEHRVSSQFVAEDGNETPRDDHRLQRLEQESGTEFARPCRL